MFRGSPKRLPLAALCLPLGGQLQRHVFVERVQSSGSVFYGSCAFPNGSEGCIFLVEPKPPFWSRHDGLGSHTMDCHHERATRNVKVQDYHYGSMTLPKACSTSTNGSCTEQRRRTASFPSHHAWIIGFWLRNRQGRYCKSSHAQYSSVMNSCGDCVREL